MLLEDLDAAGKEELRCLEEEDLWLCHFGIAMYVRNAYGLWSLDCPIVSPTGIPADLQAEDVSMACFPAERKMRSRRVR